MMSKGIDPEKLLDNILYYNRISVNPFFMSIEKKLPGLTRRSRSECNGDPVLSEPDWGWPLSSILQKSTEARCP